MEIEEIKCPLCQDYYDEHDKAPILLPECGHSFCYKCITEAFELVHRQQQEFDMIYN
jgi:hypothetical protein